MTIDEDVYLALAENAKKKFISIDELVARILRDWLTNCETASAGRRPRYEEKTYDMGRPLVDLTKALQISADLEDQEIIEKWRRSE